MARTIRLLLVGLPVLIGASLNAQSPRSPVAMEITLGQAAVPLYGPWKFTIGDSPTDPKNGKPLWAEPDFDDSSWSNRRWRKPSPRRRPGKQKTITTQEGSPFGH